MFVFVFKKLFMLKYPFIHGCKMNVQTFFTSKWTSYSTELLRMYMFILYMCILPCFKILIPNYTE